MSASLRWVSWWPQIGQLNTSRVREQPRMISTASRAAPGAEGDTEECNVQAGQPNVLGSAPR
jgi:hypothetical protein